MISIKTLTTGLSIGLWLLVAGIFVAAAFSYGTIDPALAAFNWNFSTSLPGALASIISTQALDMNDITLLLENIRNLLIFFGVIVIGIFIIIAGWQYVTARGDAAKIESAKGNLIGALIGGVIILGAIALVNMLISMVGRRDILST